MQSQLSFFISECGYKRTTFEYSVIGCKKQGRFIYLFIFAPLRNHLILFDILGDFRCVELTLIVKLV